MSLRLQASGWAICIVAVVLGMAWQRSHAAQPNVVVILADDLGYGSTNAYGADPRLVRTPGIDRLAREGMRFTDANSTSSVCSPSRYAFLTGRYAWRTALPSGVLRWNAPLLIEPGRDNLAALFRRHNYQTAAIGKWHLGYGVGQADFKGRLDPGPLELGFDFHFGVPANHGDRVGVFVENHRVLGLRSSRTMPVEKRSYYNNQKFVGLDAPQRRDDEVMQALTERSIEWIEKRDRDRPFFLYFAPVAVHEPVTPSSRTSGTSQAGPYGDWIHELDDSVGRLLAVLDREGITNDTIVLFTSDNGGVTDHGLPQLVALTTAARVAGLQINAGLRLGKGSIFQGGFKVPYVVRWPGKIPPGKVSAQMLSLVDTYATFAALLGEERSGREPAAEDSINLLPVWLDKKIDRPPRSYLVLESGAGTFAVRAGNWKWIEGWKGGAAASAGRPVRPDEVKPQLYNLRTDPSERADVIASNEMVVKHLSRVLTQVRERGSPANTVYGS